MVTIALTAGRGGVGKTALTFHLAHLLAAHARVLMVDADPQASLTWATGATVNGPTLADVLAARNPADAAPGAVVVLGDSLALMPATFALAGLEMTLAGKIGRELLLRRALEPLGALFDVCLIDCPPALGMLGINGLVAARGVVVPMIADAMSLHAAGALLATIDEARALAPGLELVGVVLNMYSDTFTLHRAARDALQGAGVPVFNTTIGRSVKVSEALGAHEPLTTFDADNPRATEFRSLAKELQTWLRKANRT